MVAPVIALDRVADLTDAGLCLDSGEHLRQYLIAAMEGDVEGSGNGVYVVDGGTGRGGSPAGCTVAHGEAVLEMVWRAKLPCTIVLDEAHNWYSERDKNEDLDQILREGRHWGISVVACTRRPQNLGSQLLSESLLSVFEHGDVQGRKRAAEVLGPDVKPRDVGELNAREYLLGGRTSQVSDEILGKLYDGSGRPTGQLRHKWIDGMGQAITA
jgi:hypothetical protein